MSNKFKRARTGLLIPKSADPGPLGLDPTVTKVELPTIGVACPHEKGTGTGQCPNGGEDLPVKHVHRISATQIRYGFHCPGCGYESEMTMEGLAQRR